MALFVCNCLSLGDTLDSLSNQLDDKPNTYKDAASSFCDLLPREQMYLWVLWSLFKPLIEDRKAGFLIFF